MGPPLPGGLGRAQEGRGTLNVDRERLTNEGRRGVLSCHRTLSPTPRRPKRPRQVTPLLGSSDPLPRDRSLLCPVPRLSARHETRRQERRVGAEGYWRSALPARPPPTRRPSPRSSGRPGPSPHLTRLLAEPLTPVHGPACARLVEGAPARVTFVEPSAAARRLATTEPLSCREP